LRALVYLGPNTVICRDEPDPVPREGEALIAVEAVGICGSDLHAYHGHDERRPPPLILGHEAAGRVLSGAMAGQRVAINPLVIAPDCAFALAGLPHLSPTRQILSMPPRPGAFAQLVCAPEANLVAIPDHLPAGKAALAEPLAVSCHAVWRGLSLLRTPRPEAHCLVQGGGAIGLGAALALIRGNVADITIVEPNAGRRKVLAKLGNWSVASPEELADNRFFDLVIDAVGASSTRRDASRLVKPGGVIVHLGLLPGHDGYDVRRITLQEITVSGSYCYTPEEFRKVVGLMAWGGLGSLGWHEEMSLCDGPAAFRSLDEGSCQAPKIILRP
jgi:threonine dehydrogenase-like Zn-dependent dehydrogenase